MRLAICVATCGRPALLRRLLGRLGESEIARTAPAGTFLVVVDNGPDREARAICAAAGPGLGVPLRFVEEPRRGISFARNRALATAFAAGADFVAFLDDDDLPRPDWLGPLLAAQAAADAELVFGCWELPPEPETQGFLREAKFFRAPDTGRLNRYGLPQWAGTYNVLIARRLIERLAPDGTAFAPELALIGGSDMDLFIRAAGQGARIAVAPESLVVRGWDAARCTWRGVLRRAFRNGVSHATMERRHLAPGAFRRRLRKGVLGAGRAYAHLLVMPLALLGGRRPDHARILLEAVRRTGELWVYAGGGFRYYGGGLPAGPVSRGGSRARTRPGS